MNITDIKNKIFSRYLMYHLLGMVSAVIILCIGISFGLDIYTHHGENIEVPDLKGIDHSKAVEQLGKLGLVMEVSDSGYNKQLPANTILAQTPSHGLHVKQGHIIYVTINSPSSPTFSIPDIVDNSSVREAEARLTAMGFRLTEPQYVDGEKDWVYGILCRGHRVSNGDRISIDHPLTLMVGKGTLDDMDEMGFADEYTTTQEGEVDEFEEVKEPPTKK